MPQPAGYRSLPQRIVRTEIASAGRSSVAAIALLMLLAACSDDQPARAPEITGVNGHVHTTCHQLLAEFDLPTDLSTSTIQVLVPDDSPGGYRVVNGHGDANGGFVIDDVPADITFTLRIEDDYYVTDQRVVDLRSEIGVRCAPPPEEALSRTPVTVR